MKTILSCLVCFEMLAAELVPVVPLYKEFVVFVIFFNRSSAAHDG